MGELPAPLAPLDCDCRGLPFMPLEVSRLVDSDLTALSTGDEFKAAVLLWARSWSEIPAASLPDDDRILARKAGYSLAEWRDLKEMALRGWVRCADGRLYHPVIADLAVAASAKRKGQAAKATSRWAKAKAAQTSQTAAAMPPDMPQQPESDATASECDTAADATAMQVKGTVEGTVPPLRPPKGPNARSVRKADVEAIWTVTPRPGRERSSKADLERALRAALSRGREPHEVLAGVRAYYASEQATKNGGEFAKGVHRIIENDRWASFVSDAAAGTNGVDPEAQRWRGRVGEFSRNRWWEETNWGPKPGKPGCEAPRAVLAEFGFAYAEA